MSDMMTIIATILPIELIVIAAGAYVRQHFPDAFDVYVSVVIIPVATAVMMFVFNIFIKNILSDEEE